MNTKSLLSFLAIGLAVAPLHGDCYDASIMNEGSYFMTPSGGSSYILFEKAPGEMMKQDKPMMDKEKPANQNPSHSSEVNTFVNRGYNSGALMAPNGTMMDANEMKNMDEAIMQKIQAAMDPSWFSGDADDVEVIIDQGAVRIEGEVGSLDDQQKMIDAIKKIDGVTSVQSNLSVDKD